jgi:PHP family Zn ribbon phosphoesterase
MDVALRRYRADLHVHTALSPCASEAMTPPAILAAARERRISLIGVVDHNAAGNARAMVAAAAAPTAGEPVRVLPGIEVETSEGVHVVCLCDNADTAEELQEFVWARLPSAPNRAQTFGEQVLLTPNGRPQGQEMRLLLQSADVGVEELCSEGQRRGLLTIAAHVTRRAYGLIGVLGFVPPQLPVDALELGAPGQTPMPVNGQAQGDLTRYPQVRSSDAHQLEDVGRVCTEFWLAEPTVAELRLALRQSLGRRVSTVVMEP